MYFKDKEIIDDKNNNISLDNNMIVCVFWWLKMTKKQNCLN